MSAPVASDTPQPVGGEWRDQRLLGGRAEPSGDQQGTDLVAVKAGRVPLVSSQGRWTCMARGVIERVFINGVPVGPTVVVPT